MAKISKPPASTSKPAILLAAVSLARKRGLLRFSRIEVAQEAGVGESTVSYHFGKMPELRIAVVRYAAEHEIMPILTDARAARESFGMVPMSADLREKVANYIAS